MDNEYKNDIEQISMIACEPMAQWGGKWTEEKLDTFEKYVNAYLTIMNVHRDKYNWKLIYFDGFAGSGSRENKNKEEESNLLQELFKDDSIAREELDLYKGAAERVLGINQRGFDYYYFIDKDKDTCSLASEFTYFILLPFSNTDNNFCSFSLDSLSLSIK